MALPASRSTDMLQRGGATMCGAKCAFAVDFRCVCVTEVLRSCFRNFATNQKVRSVAETIFADINDRRAPIWKKWIEITPKHIITAVEDPSTSSSSIGECVVGMAPHQAERRWNCPAARAGHLSCANSLSLWRHKPCFAPAQKDKRSKYLPNEATRQAFANQATSLGKPVFRAIVASNCCRLKKSNKHMQQTHKINT